MIKNFCIVFLLMLASSSLALSGEDKNVAVDQAIGGMEQGRRISAPGSDNNKNIISEKQGSGANPVTDAHAHPFLQTTGNQGYMYFNAGANGPQNAINRSGSQQTSGALNASNALTGANPSQAGGPINGGATGQTSTANQNSTEHPTTQTSAGSITVETGTSQTHTGTGEAMGSPAGAVQAGTQQIGSSVNTGAQAGQAVTEQTSGSVNTGTPAGQTAVTGQVNNPSNTGSITAGTGETHTGSSSSVTTAQEPSGTPSNPVEPQGNGGVLIGGETSPTDGSSGASSNPIVSVEAGTNPNSGTPNAGVQVDTSGQLEDRQILDAGVAGAGTGSSGTQVGGASEATGSSTVHNADVTTQPVISTTGQTIPGTTEIQTGSGSGTTTQEPSGTSSNPIVGVEANTNPASGTPNAGVQVDTSGQLEDRQIVDAGVTGQTGSTEVEAGSATDVTGQELVHEADITTEPVVGTGQTITEQTGAGSTTTTQEPSGNPIVGIEAGTNPESGTPTAGVAVDTTGELEDRQILQTDLAVEGVASSGQVGGASEITGSSAVHNIDVTTQPVTSATGQTVTGTTETQTGNGPGTSTQGPSGASSNPIVSVEAGTNPESGTPNAGVQVDTSGQLEDRQILDAGVTGAGTGSSETQMGSASGITGSGTVGGLDVTTQPVESIVPAPSDLSAEVDTTGQTVGGAADVGVEADVSGVSEASDVGSEPAAGLPSGTTVKTGL